MTRLRPRLAIAASSLLIFSAAERALAQEAPAEQSSGSKQSAEARLAAGAKPQASATAGDVIKTLSATHRFEQTAISPDGRKVAWVEDIITKRGVSTGDTVIYVSEVDRKNPPKRISAGVADGIHAEGSVAWSPDGKKLAFLSDAAKAGQLQLYVIEAAGRGSARKITQVKGFLSTPGWSPDGRTIAVLFTENATRAAGPLVAETPETGEIKDSFFEQRLALVDVATGKLRQISPADTYVYEYDWAPDGLRFAVTAALGNGDNNWWVAELYTLEGASGLMKSIYKPHLQIANPVWSPDGERIAFVEGLMSDAGLTGGDIFSVDAGGGEGQNLTPEIKASASWIGWTPEKKIIFTEFVGGDVGLASVDPQSKKVEALWRGGEYLAAGAGGFSPTISLAKDGATMAFVRESYAAPPEVWAGKVGEWKQLTQRNERVTREWGDAKSIEWKNGGYEVQGWLLYPKNFDASKKYPLVVNVHGGPSWASVAKWPSPHGYA